MASRTLSETQYRQLADFRHTLRRFLRFSETAAEKAGISGQQYQALLALRAAGAVHQRTIGYVARCLLIKHNTAVELVDRLVKQRLVERRDSAEDRRKVQVSVTAKGQRILDRLVLVHRQELDRLAVHIVQMNRNRPRRDG
jgi:DNA-binding MarR family transcriptional regulator